MGDSSRCRRAYYHAGSHEAVRDSSVDCEVRAEARRARLAPLAAAPSLRNLRVTKANRRDRRPTPNLLRHEGAPGAGDILVHVARAPRC